jgi:quercetin dioxygenase-like cupin family protein
MEHRTASEHEWTPSPTAHFTGHVWFGPLSQDGPLNALAVQFSPGARTDWHSHPEGQVLYVVSGSGLVQNEAGQSVRISAGDVVHLPVPFVWE